MKPKKSLGQHFLIEKNIVKKILGLCDFNNRNVIEIGPGKGALTDEILKLNPKTLTIIEKDLILSKQLKKKYNSEKRIKIINKDVLKFDFNNFKKKKNLIIGNLPYNISSQILVKIIKYKLSNIKFNDLIFMFQKELGEKIICKFPSKNYGRLSILTNLRLKVLKKFYVSANCFFPKPNVTSMVIHFKIIKRNNFKIKEISSLEKITNIIFSTKRKMINKSIRKILSDEQLKNIPELNLKLRAEEIKPEIFYKIAEIYEKN